MEQHPIPQNVSSYQFKLVGDMTLKQFFQVAGGILAGIIFYSTPLLPIIKWPLVGISILLGIGLAFLPFEERPLERWIVAFFRAVYSPTIFTWQKNSISSKLFQDETIESANTQQDVALKDYLNKTSQAPSALSNLDKLEGNFLKGLTGLFNATPATAVTQSTPLTSPTQQIPTAVPIPQTPITSASPTVVQSNPIIGNITVNPPPETTQVKTQTSNVYASPALKIPVNTPIQVPVTTHNIVVEEKAVTPTTTTLNTVTPVMAGNDIISTTQAMFSPEAAPPSPPTFPNVVVGQIIDQDRKTVEGAIMEIRDSAGRPIRALRSNKVGHFITVTQLDNGHYEIIIEKDGYEFVPVSFEAVGSLIQPILIRGKRLSPLIEMPAVPVKPVYSIN